MLVENKSIKPLLLRINTIIIRHFAVAWVGCEKAVPRIKGFCESHYCNIIVTNVFMVKVANESFGVVVSQSRRECMSLFVRLFFRRVLFHIRWWSGVGLFSFFRDEFILCRSRHFVDARSGRVVWMYLGEPNANLYNGRDT